MQTNVDDAVWEPGTRSITAPFPLGRSAEGEQATFALWVPQHGARHPLMGGATGGGKTNTLNVITTGIVAASDTVLWYIDVAKKGQAAAPWGPTIDWTAVTPAEAVAMLTAAVDIVAGRSEWLARQAAQEGDDDKVRPSPGMPLLVIIIDEAAALFGIASGKDAIAAAQATERARGIAQTGRSAAVSLVIATQRPTVASLGHSGDLRAQLHPNICLRMNRRSDTGFVLPGIDPELIDTTLFNHAGMLYVQDATGAEPIPIRSYALYRPDIVRQIARLYAPHRPSLDALSRNAAGASYARRPVDPFGISVNSGSAPTTPTLTARNPVSATQLHGVRAEIKADEQLPSIPTLSVTSLANGHAAQPAPEEPGDATHRTRALEALSKSGADGLSANDIRQAIDINRTRIYTVLRQLIDSGHVQQTGTKGRFRYHTTAR